MFYRVIVMASIFAAGLPRTKHIDAVLTGSVNVKTQQSPIRINHLLAVKLPHPFP